jgi:hypothetical protein
MEQPMSNQTPDQLHWTVRPAYKSYSIKPIIGITIRNTRGCTPSVLVKFVNLGHETIYDSTTVDTGMEKHLFTEHTVTEAATIIQETLTAPPMVDRINHFIEESRRNPADELLQEVQQTLIVGIHKNLHGPTQ